MRIFETSRRHPGRVGDITGIVLLERGLGGAGTVLLGAIGFVLAYGHYDVGAYLWLEGLFVVGTLLLGFLFFSRARAPVACVLPGRSSCACRLERPMRAFYDGVHHFRGHPRLLVGVFLFTTAIQAVRILSIWAAARAVDIELGPRIDETRWGRCSSSCSSSPSRSTGSRCARRSSRASWGTSEFRLTRPLRGVPLLPGHGGARSSRVAPIMLWEGLRKGTRRLQVHDDL